MRMLILAAAVALVACTGCVSSKVRQLQDRLDGQLAALSAEQAQLEHRASEAERATLEAVKAGDADTIAYLAQYKRQVAGQIDAVASRKSEVEVQADAVTSEAAKQRQGSALGWLSLIQQVAMGAMGLGALGSGAKGFLGMVT